jgi:hypothetical protein
MHFWHKSCYNSIVDRHTKWLRAKKGGDEFMFSHTLPEDGMNILQPMLAGGSEPAGENTPGGGGDGDGVDILPLLGINLTLG